MTVLRPASGVAGPPAPADEPAGAARLTVPFAPVSGHRHYRGLPTRRDPLLIVECARPAYAYARDYLLAPPPGPPWRTHAHRLAIAVLGAAPLWRLLPTVPGPVPDPGLPLPQALHERVAGCHVVALRHSRDQDASTVLTLISPGPSATAVVAKVAACPRSRARLAREADRLAELSTIDMGPTARRTVPDTLAFVDDGRHAALVTTACPGTSALVRFHRACNRRQMPGVVGGDLRAAGRWLAEFQRDTARGHAPLCDPSDPSPQTRLESGPVADDPALPAALDALSAARSRLARRSAACTAVHGDFWMGNLLLAGDQITGVCDWEHFRPAGPPTADLARLVLASVTYLDRHTRPGHRVRRLPGLRAHGLSENVRYVLTSSGWLPELMRGFLRDHLARLDLPDACVQDLLALEAARIAAEATDAGFARAHLQLLRALEETR